ncbi:putative cysteine--tRNA ligase, mitochondrial [Ciona intestinalis]
MAKTVKNLEGLKHSFYQWKLPKGHDTGIKVKNSYGCLRQQKALAPLVVADPKHVTWYACGPTVYDKTHIGHASSYIRFDTIRRILTNYFGLTISMVMGVTNIDDKIITRANLLNKEFLSMAEHYENEFKSDLSNLNILPPIAYVRVSEIVPELLSFIYRLLEQRHAYVSKQGNVWFDVDQFTKVGKLVPIHQEWKESDSGGEKRCARDFALWKAAKPGEPYWEAPWGKGRPGWHLECSTIASLYFGKQIDIHSGASDLEFPHHESEILQSEAFHCEDQWANYFLHSGLLKFGKSKMSKSLGNVVNVDEALKRHSPDVLRYLCLSTAWHTNLSYTNKDIKHAEASVQQLKTFLSKCQQYVQGNIETKTFEAAAIYHSLDTCKSEVYACMCNDFDTPGVLQALKQLCYSVGETFGKQIVIENWEPGNHVRNTKPFVKVMTYVTETFTNLGFQNISAANTDSKPDVTTKVQDDILGELLKFRTKIRKLAMSSNKTSDDGLKQLLFKECDYLRNELSNKGISIKDWN